MKFLSAVLLSVLIATGFAPVASATTDDLTVTVLKRTSCDQRAPRVRLDIGPHAELVGYGPAHSDAIYWLDTDGVSTGTHSYTLKRQPFGSTRTWVMLVGYEGDQGLTTSRTLTFTRPDKASCVATQLMSLDTFRAGINASCPTDSVSLYIISIWVKRGTPGYIVTAPIARLVQKNGTMLENGRGYVVPPKERRTEFYLYAGRHSKLNLEDISNRARVVTSTSAVELKDSVYRTCQGEVA